MKLHIPLAPVPKPRMTRSDSWKKRPAVVRYWAFKDSLHELVRGDLDPRFAVQFNVAMPVSWSKKKRSEMLGKPHQQKPDVDNYLKALMDALCSDDSYVYDVHCTKYWAEEGSIELEQFGD